MEAPGACPGAKPGEFAQVFMGHLMSQACITCLPVELGHGVSPAKHTGPCGMRVGYPKAHLLAVTRKGPDADKSSSRPGRPRSIQTCQFSEISNYSLLQERNQPVRSPYFPPTSSVCFSQSRRWFPLPPSPWVKYQITRGGLSTPEPAESIQKPGSLVSSHGNHTNGSCPPPHPMPQQATPCLLFLGI